MFVRDWHRWVGVALVMALFATAVFAIPLLRQSAIFLSVLCLAGAAVLLIACYRKKDPYSLSELARIHELEELRDVEMPAVIHGDAVVCPHCGSVYPSCLPVCSNCQRSPSA